MKRFISLLCCVLVVLSSFGLWIPADAAEVDSTAEEILVSESVEYLEDGRIITTSVYEAPVVTRATVYNKSGRKVLTESNADGETLYTFTVSGIFTVREGSSAVCISSSYSTNIVNDAWYCYSASASKSANKAIADGVFKKKLLGITVETDTRQVVLTCDIDGAMF